MSDNLRQIHEHIAFFLGEIQEGLGGFPRATVIVRDPDRPGRYIIVGNEPPEVTDAIKAAIGVNDNGERVSHSGPTPPEGPKQ